MIFTAYVRQLVSLGKSPGEEIFAEVWEELCRLLERELRKRGLWEMPPSYLGVYGSRSWWIEDSSSTHKRAQGDGLGELAAELYSYVFVDRLNKLIDYVERGNSIEALVSVNTGHLLYELQKKHDPLGYRVFTILHQAVQEALNAGELFVLRGDPRIRNDTMLSAHANLNPDNFQPVPEDTVREWNDVLMPDLVKGKGKARQWVITTLQTFLRRLPEEGIEVFLFRNLLDPLKKDARLRWALRLESTLGEKGLAESSDSDEEPPRVVPLVPPDPSVEDQGELGETRSMPNPLPGASGNRPIAGRAGGSLEGSAAPGSRRGSAVSAQVVR